MLVGSSGGDVLAGRGGADRFVYHDTDDSAPKFSDRILDFSRSQGDRIDLAIIDANEQASGDQAFQLIGQASSPPPASSAATSRTATPSSRPTPLI